MNYKYLQFIIYRLLYRHLTVVPGYTIWLGYTTTILTEDIILELSIYLVKSCLSRFFTTQKSLTSHSFKNWSVKLAIFHKSKQNIKNLGSPHFFWYYSKRCFLIFFEKIFFFKKSKYCWEEFRIRSLMQLSKKPMSYRSITDRQTWGYLYRQNNDQIRGRSDIT